MFHVLLFIPVGIYTDESTHIKGLYGSKGECVVYSRRAISYVLPVVASSGGGHPSQQMSSKSVDTGPLGFIFGD